MSSLINTADMVCDCVELSQLNCLLFPLCRQGFCALHVRWEPRNRFSHIMMIHI